MNDPNNDSLRYELITYGTRWAVQDALYVNDPKMPVHADQQTARRAVDRLNKRNQHHLAPRAPHTDRTTAVTNTTTTQQENPS